MRNLKNEFYNLVANRKLVPKVILEVLLLTFIYEGFIIYFSGLVTKGERRKNRVEGCNRKREGKGAK